jgi:hypothetical protein
MTSSVIIKSKIFYRDVLEGCPVLSVTDYARFSTDFVK